MRKRTVGVGSEKDLRPCPALLTSAVVGGAESSELREGGAGMRRTIDCMCLLARLRVRDWRVWSAGRVGGRSLGRRSEVLRRRGVY